MSTKKIKDGVSKKPVTTSSKTKTTREQSTDRKTITKKEEKTVSKTRSTTKLPPSKKSADEDDKLKKTPSKPQIQTSSRKVSRPTAPQQIKKIASNTPKISSRTKAAAEKPGTPPSSRVTKMQYFPSKKLYHNALKREDVKINIPNKVESSSTVSVRNSSTPRKTNPSEASSDTSSISERPRTATLRKGSIVNNNIVGPDVPKHKVPRIKKVVDETPDEYEDDFESYESDFEEYDSSTSDSVTNIPSDSATSSSESDESLEQQAPKRVSSAGTDDEKKLDSGNYELPESRHRQILDNIKESIEKENANLDQERNSTNALMGSLSDEGFEDGKSLQFINFLGAQRKYQHRKSLELRRKRGEEILSMIRLDHYSFTLFDLAPVPYDVFIKNFGKSNSVQTSVQTGEDDLDEEVQTEEITCLNKWTQFPPTFPKMDQRTTNFLEDYKCNYLGVGGDRIEETKPDENINENSLEKFLVSAGNLILNIQAEENFQLDDNSQKESSVPFCKGYILYNTQIHNLLKNRPIKDINFSWSNTNKILTVHGPRDNDFDKSIVCLWHMSNVQEPEMFLVSFGEVSSCSFSIDCPSLIFGGSNNGSLVIWDTKESPNFHKNVEDEPQDIILRTPTYSTEINQGHSCKIVSIVSLVKSSRDSDLFTEQKSAEICSLDEDGEVIIWSVIFKESSRGRVVENQGLSHWGAVIITINTRISLKKLYPEIHDFKCTDLALSQFDSSHLYISTNFGIILHCLSSGGRTCVKKFIPDIYSQANCLEMCPFSPQYILAGFDNGNISFYSRVIEKPLMVLSNKDTIEGKCKIEKIQWSYNRPLIFYAIDETNTIHVWDLKVSDMFPIYSVPFKDNIVSMKLSPSIIKDNEDVPEKTYMMIATDKGTVYMYLLDDEHGQQSSEEFDKDRKRFFNYINRYV